MRIKTLRLNNIGSFKGQHVLDLENTLKGIDLFAITGPTGAGKSTLLNAVCLALYGKGLKKSLSAVDYISSDETSGSIHLSFAQGVNNYEAFWSCKKSRPDGSLLKAPLIRREVFLQGIPYQGEMNEILGLSFEQFTKTVILPQGEFHRFISATAQERREILEGLWHGPNLKGLATTLMSDIDQLQAKKHYLLETITNLQSSLYLDNQIHLDDPNQIKNGQFYDEKLQSYENLKNYVVKWKMQIKSFKDELSQLYSLISKDFQNSNESNRFKEQFDFEEGQYKLYGREIEKLEQNFEAEQKRLKSLLKEHFIQINISKDRPNLLNTILNKMIEAIDQYTSMVGVIWQKKDGLSSKLFESGRKRQVSRQLISNSEENSTALELQIFQSYSNLLIRCKLINQLIDNDLFPRFYNLIASLLDDISNISQTTSPKQSPQAEVEGNHFQIFRSFITKLGNMPSQGLTALNKEILLLSIENVHKSNTSTTLSYIERVESSLDGEMSKLKSYRDHGVETWEKIEANKRELENVSYHLSKAQHLFKAIGKNEFRDYLLTHLEHALIIRANKELESFFQGRYQLVTRFGQDIQIFDTLFWSPEHKDYHSQCRKISSLSGGETFLVGLALGLALSDLFQGGPEIESFFIDEGFGGLDPESLQETFEGLQILAARGKQVGIISHVETLNLQVPVRFEIQKSGKGVSFIQIEGLEQLS